MRKTIILYLIVFVVGLGVGAGGVYLAVRGPGDSEQLISELQAENRELNQRLGEIQGAVDAVGTGIEGAANEAGSIADSLDSVIGGLGGSIDALRELLAAFEQIERILESRESPSPPG